MSSSSSLLLGVDLGTTHCKGALFESDGALLGAAVRPTPLSRAEDGLPFHHPAELWGVTASAIREGVRGTDGRPVGAVGVTSMAEAGLLIDAATGTPRPH